MTDAGARIDDGVAEALELAAEVARVLRDGAGTDIRAQVESLDALHRCLATALAEIDPG